MKFHSGFEAKVLASFAATVLVVAGLATTTWKVTQDASDATQRVVRTHEVLNSLAATKADTLQIEFSTQSYRISGDPARLAERDLAIATRETLLSRVKQLTGDNARQQARWTQLREVINERLAISRHVELLRRTQGPDVASAFVAGAPLQETRERTYGLMREMDNEEQRLLESHNAEQLRTRQVVVAAGGLVALLSFTLLAATYVLIRRQLRETEASRRALANSEESLSTTLYSIGDAVLATDAGARITRMNPVAEALTGWSFADAQGRPVEEVFHIVNEHTREPAEVPVAKALATGEVQELAITRC